MFLTCLFRHLRTGFRTKDGSQQKTNLQSPGAFLNEAFMAEFPETLSLPSGGWGRSRSFFDMSSSTGRPSVCRLAPSKTPGDRSRDVGRREPWNFCDGIWDMTIKTLNITTKIQNVKRHKSFTVYTARRSIRCILDHVLPLIGQALKPLLTLLRRGLQQRLPRNRLGSQARRNQLI